VVRQEDASARPAVAGGPRTLGDVFGGLASLTIAEGVAVAAFLAIVVGSIGPWVTTPLASAAGTTGDGSLTIALAVVALFQFPGRYRSRVQSAFMIAMALGASAIAIYDGNHLPSSTVFGVQLVHAGWGLHLVVASGIVAALAVLRSALKRRA
jgi:hypothetical protein